MFRALSSSLVQIYNIFARNANRFNISQHSMKCEKTSFAQARVGDVLYYEAGGGNEAFSF